jgi:hypothetical protein
MFDWLPGYAFVVEADAVKAGRMLAAVKVENR